MYKRALLIFSIALFLIAPLGAKVFEIGFGSILQFMADPFSAETTQTTWINMDNYLNGFELRMRIAKLEVDAHLLTQQGKIIGQTDKGGPIYLDDISNRISGSIAIGTATEIAPKTYFGWALALPMGCNLSVTEGLIFWLGDSNNDFRSGEIVSFSRNISFAYRLKFDVRFSHFILSATYQVPSSGFSYDNFNQSALAPNWSQGKLGFAFVGILW